MNINFGTIKGKLSDSWASFLAFGDKNAPALMTGGSIILGWTAAYFFWKGTKEAEEAIQKEEEKLKTIEAIQNGETVTDALEAISDGRAELSKKDKILIYLQYCWLSLVLGVASTGLSIGAQKLSMDRLAEMYLLTKFLEDKNDKKDTVIEKLKEKAGIKNESVADNELLDDIIDGEYTDEDIQRMAREAEGNGDKLIVDCFTNHFWNGSVVKVSDGICEANSYMIEKRKNIVNKKLATDKYSNYDGPFDYKSDTGASYSEEEDYPSEDDDDEYSEVYSTLPLCVLLELIGDPHAKDPRTFKLGDKLEFRYRWKGDLLRPSLIMRMEKRGNIEYCLVDYDRPNNNNHLVPSSELMNRSPY